MTAPVDPQFAPDRTLDRRTLGFVAVACLAMLFAGSSSGAIDVDLFHELSLWREVLATHSFPTKDPFAFTPTYDPVVHHEWGFGAIVYGAVGVLGSSGVVLVKFLLVALLAILGVRVARHNGGHPYVIAALSPLFVVLTWFAYATVRAHLFTLVGLALFLSFLRDDREGGRRWILPAALFQLLWQNCHGGFVIVFPLLALHALECAARRRPFRHLLLVAAMFLALIAIGPWGTHYYAYLWRALSMPRDLITEWDPLYSEISAPLVSFAIALVPIGYAIAQRGLSRLPGLPIVVFFLAEAVAHQRFVPLFAVATFAHLPSWLSATPFCDAIERIVARRRFLIAYFSVIVIVPMLAQAVVRRFWELRVPAFSIDRSDEIYPVGPVEYLKENGFSGNLWTAFGDGSYVSWKLHPQVKVSLDSRYEVAYPPDVVEEHQKFFAAEGGFASSLDAHHADCVLVSVERPVSSKMKDLPGWNLCYRDDAYEVYQRITGTLPSKDRRGETFEGVFP